MRLHPEWAAPAVFRGLWVRESGLMLEPDMCHGFQPHNGVNVKLSAILESTRVCVIIKCVIDRTGEDDGLERTVISIKFQSK